MKYLFIFAACMMLDAIVPKSCQSEEYQHRYDNWTTEDADSLNADTLSEEAAQTPAE